MVLLNVAGVDPRITKLLKYLGIDPHKTNKVVITIVPDDIVKVELEQNVSIEGAEPEWEAKSFYLTEIKEKDGIS